MTISRRGVAGLLALAGIGVGRAAADDVVKIHRVAIQVSTHDAGVYDLALGNAINLAREFGEVGEEVEVEVVVYGPGLHMVRADTTPVAARIHSVTQSIPGVRFVACGNTISTMEKTEGKPINLLPGVKIVKAGAPYLVTLQESGWSYLRV